MKTSQPVHRGSRHSRGPGGHGVRTAGGHSGGCILQPFQPPDPGVGIPDGHIQPGISKPGGTGSYEPPRPAGIFRPGRGIGALLWPGGIGNNRRAMGEINVVPLAGRHAGAAHHFHVVAAPMMVQGLDVDLPETDSGALKSSDDTLVLVGYQTGPGLFG